MSAFSDTRPMRAGPARAGGGSLALVVVLAGAALALASWHLSLAVAPSRWWAVALHPDPADPVAILFAAGALPRLAVAALCGAGLAVAGGLAQAVLGNPLAVPGTLGVSAGAQLAVLVAGLLLPQGWGVPQDVAALLGGFAALGAVLAVAATGCFAPTALVLAGLAVGLLCAALGGTLTLFNHEDMGAAALWAAGSLAQEDWSTSLFLLPRLVVLFALSAVLLRPVQLMALSDAGARGLGVPLGFYRAAALAVAVALAATVTAKAGIIGFVDLAAPLAVGLAGARRLGPRLALSAVAGAAILVVVDVLAQVVGDRLGAMLPTGAVTGAAAAPLLLGLLSRLRGGVPAREAASVPARHARPWRGVAALGVAAILAVLLAVLVGRTGAGWSWPGEASAGTLRTWRIPRTGMAFGAGAALGSAGAILQRLTGNLMASPESLGLGAAAMVGFAAMLFLDPAADGPAVAGAGAVGVLALLAILLGGSWRAGFAPDRLLLLGVSLAAALNAVLVALLAANDPRAMVLTGWMMGSTAAAEGIAAVALLLATLAALAVAMLFGRPLDLLALGQPLARSLGVAGPGVRFGLMGLAALLTAGAVLAVGPLTFVGLLGPQVAARLGLNRSVHHLPGAALVGGLVMVVADWLGRVVAAPFELPAGLVAALIGIPALLFLLRRRARPRATAPVREC